MKEYIHAFGIHYSWVCTLFLFLLGRLSYVTLLFGITSQISVFQFMSILLLPWRMFCVSLSYIGTAVLSELLKNWPVMEVMDAAASCHPLSNLHVHALSVSF
jgi:hypothetical protein